MSKSGAVSSLETSCSGRLGFLPFKTEFDPEFSVAVFPECHAEFFPLGLGEEQRYKPNATQYYSQTFPFVFWSFRNAKRTHNKLS
jgi:hypothetical protein